MVKRIRKSRPNGTHRTQPLSERLRNGKIKGLPIVLELRQVCGTKDGRPDFWLSKDPVDGDLGHAPVKFLGHLFKYGTHGKWADL